MKTLMTLVAGLLFCILSVWSSPAQTLPGKPTPRPVKKLTPAEDFKDTLAQYQKIAAVFDEKEKEYDVLSSRMEKQATEVKEGWSKGPLDTVAVCKALSELNRLHVSNFDWYDLMDQSQSDVKDNIDLRFAWSGVQEIYPTEEQKINDEDKLWGCGLTKNSIKGQPSALVKPLSAAPLSDRKKLEAIQLNFDQSYKAYVGKLDVAVKIAGDPASPLQAQCTAIIDFTSAANQLEGVLGQLANGVTEGWIQKTASAAELQAIKTVIAWRSEGFAQNKSNGLKDLQTRGCLK